MPLLCLRMPIAKSEVSSFILTTAIIEYFRQNLKKKMFKGHFPAWFRRPSQLCEKLSVHACMRRNYYMHGGDIRKMHTFRDKSEIKDSHCSCLVILVTFFKLVWFYLFHSIIIFAQWSAAFDFYEILVNSSSDPTKTKQQFTSLAFSRSQYLL